MGMRPGAGLTGWESVWELGTEVGDLTDGDLDGSCDRCVVSINVRAPTVVRSDPPHHAYQPGGCTCSAAIGGSPGLFRSHESSAPQHSSPDLTGSFSSRQPKRQVVVACVRAFRELYGPFFVGIDRRRSTETTSLWRDLTSFSYPCFFLLLFLADRARVRVAPGLGAGDEVAPRGLTSPSSQGPGVASRSAAGHARFIIPQFGQAPMHVRCLSANSIPATENVHTSL